MLETHVNRGPSSWIRLDWIGTGSMSLNFEKGGVIMRSLLHFTATNTHTPCPCIHHSCGDAALAYNGLKMQRCQD